MLLAGLSACPEAMILVDLSGYRVAIAEVAVVLLRGQWQAMSEERRTSCRRDEGQGELR